MAKAPPIRFDDGAAYERMMGVWSRLAGEQFLDWLAPAKGLRWIDVGCGNGAFTQLIVERCAPAQVLGVDPSEGQLAFARTRPAAASTTFLQGDAMALPAADDACDIAVMALVLFFVPEPARGVAEMARVVRPGGTVCAYTWDILGGGFPLDAIKAAMLEMGLPVRLPPSVAASPMAAALELWSQAGLRQIETREISVQRTFTNLDDYWSTSILAATIGPTVKALPPAEQERLKALVRQRVPLDATGRITISARANAIHGRVA